MTSSPSIYRPEHQPIAEHRSNDGAYLLRIETLKTQRPKQILSDGIFGHIIRCNLL